MKCYLYLKDWQKEESGGCQLMLWLDRLCAWLELTDFKMRPRAPACLEQLIGLGSELQLPGKPLPQPCLQFFLIIVMLISCLAALMQPDLSKLCHTSGRKNPNVCLPSLSLYSPSFYLLLLLLLFFK